MKLARVVERTRPGKQNCVECITPAQFKSFGGRIDIILVAFLSSSRGLIFTFASDVWGIRGNVNAIPG